MRKAKLVVGLDVYALEEGRRVESVKDVLVDESEDRVVGLLVETGGLLAASQVVPMGAIVRFGPAAVMVRSSASVVPASSDPGVNEVLTRGGSLMGTRVVSEDGTSVGTIGDLYFDEATSAITGYEVTGVTVGGIDGGSLYLPVEEVVIVGPDAVIASSGLLERVRAAASTEPPRPNGDTAEGQGSLDDPEVLVGMRLRSDLTDSDGSVVAASGQLVTPELLQRARAGGNLEPVYAAVGIRRGPAPGEEAIASATATASDLWTRFTGMLSEMSDSAGQRLDADQTRTRLDRVNDAIGRPVTKVFLDRDDSVILDLGDLITHQAVQRAAEAGLLDSLLSCVYTGGEVSFTRDEMRAGIGAHSALDQASGGAVVVSELEDHLHEVEQPRSRSQDDDDASRQMVEEAGSAGRSAVTVDERESVGQPT